MCKRLRSTRPQNAQPSGPRLRHCFRRPDLRGAFRKPHGRAADRFQGLPPALAATVLWTVADGRTSSGFIGVGFLPWAFHAPRRICFQRRRAAQPRPSEHDRDLDVLSGRHSPPFARQHAHPILGDRGLCLCTPGSLCSAGDAFPPICKFLIR